MANKEHLELLTARWEGWNEWREKPHIITPDFSGSDLEGQFLLGKDLSEANLGGTNLTGG